MNRTLALFKMKKIPQFMCFLALAASFPELTVGQETSKDGYEVQPGDTLEISVWEEENLQRQVLVRPDGRISFPLVGEIDVTGKSVSDIRAEVSSRLEKFIPDLVVTVTVSAIQGNKIYVLGQVNTPGQFVVNPSVDVMQALSMAGGTTAFAALNDIVILRRNGDGSQQAMQFNYKDVERGRSLEQNIVLQSGDVVVVP